MSIMRGISLSLAPVMMAAMGTANAASVSFFLDQSNELPDGVNYLQVTISDSTFGMDTEAIRFDVDILSPLTSIAGSNFGIQSFGFNTLLTPATVLAAVTGLPSGWSKNSGNNQDGFGSFELVNSGTGANRQNPTLTFYISGIAGDTLLDYVALSGGTAGQGNVYFAGHVAGFNGPNGVTSAFFGGSAVVPVPAAVWLFGSAFGLLAAFRRRAVRQAA